ncbi:MAG TPA: DUF1593 domain-containing protein, partial [Clostridia bacterium]|nr:DUF1593 domain-containing protein [Clostridia bacterium]
MKVIVMTDISSCRAGRGEPDDTQSLFRLLLYSDQLEILGLIATYTNHLDRAEPALLRQVIEAYAKVQDTLCAAGPFMRAEDLASRVYSGSSALAEAQPGGPAADAVSEGARHIVRCVDASPDPVWILAWGGVYDLAQALYLARREKDAAAFAAFLAKLRIHSIDDQYDGWGPILRAEFPDLFYVVSHDS